MNITYWKFWQLVLLLWLAGPGWIQAQTPTSIGVDPAQKHQKLEGFGGSVAYFINWVPSHPNKSELYDLLFKDLGLDIIRFRNVYQHQDGGAEMPSYGDLLRGGEASLGRPVKVMLSSWSPPAILKKNGIANGGTLAKNAQGQFMYQEFAQHWLDAINAYRAIGVNPEYISIQNEPDYENTGWETCIFWPDPSDAFPSYGNALEAVYNKLRTMPNRPKIIGPEVTGVYPVIMNSYIPKLNKAYLDTYAFHLYNGGEPRTPDSFNENLASMARDYADKPRMMTEYASTEFQVNDWFVVAWLMHNALTEANVSAYLYWDLMWGNEHKPDAGLISVENPWQPNSWRYPKGYLIHPYYYSFKHFSRYIDAGYSRIQTTFNNPSVKSSAFLSEDGNKMTVVLLNIGQSAQAVSLNLNGFSVRSSQVYQSTENAFFVNKGELGASVSLPVRSVTTIVLEKGTTIGLPVAEFTATPVRGVAPLAVTCDASASVNPGTDALTYSWNFGDGTTGTGKVVTHTFTQVGDYRITLTVRNAVGSRSKEITVSATLPPGVCPFAIPLPTALPTTNKQYTFVHKKGSNAPSLSNLANLAINWDLPNKGLWQFSIQTTNGVPNWWQDLRSKMTYSLDKAQPSMSFTGSGFPGLDGDYYVSVDNGNLVLASKTKNFTLYFSSSATPPACFATAARVATQGLAPSVLVAQPNPSSHAFALSLTDGSQIQAIRIFNQTGQQVWHQEKDLSGQSRVMVGQRLKAGLYLVKVWTTTGIHTLKLVKE